MSSSPAKTKKRQSSKITVVKLQDMAAKKKVKGGKTQTLAAGLMGGTFSGLKPR